MAQQLNPEGLLAATRDHAPNDCYFDQKFGDFADDYDAEHSSYPWNTQGNCCICGRLQERMGASSSGVSRHDPFRKQWLSAVVCSPACAVQFRKNADEDFAHWKRLNDAEAARKLAQ